MVEIRGRLLIGGMVIRNLEGALDDEHLDEETEWSGYLWLDHSLQESLELGRPYRLETDDERAGQIEISGIEAVPGDRRLRVAIRGRSPLKWSPWAHEIHHDTTIVPLAALAAGEA